MRFGSRNERGAEGVEALYKASACSKAAAIPSGADPPSLRPQPSGPAALPGSWIGSDTAQRSRRLNAVVCSTARLVHVKIVVAF
jgi:hypothetical protein